MTGGAYDQSGDDGMPVFRCAQAGFEAFTGDVLLGSFDGRDQRELHAHQIPDRRTQLLVSMHERLHHELQWSTVWGVTAAMSGLLAGEGVDTPRLRSIATHANAGARQVHELFATTVGVGVVGVPEGRALLTGNSTYLSYLEAGLRLGGPDIDWPWQFRESAIQMLLRSLMQPAPLARVADLGFGKMRLRDLAEVDGQPDRVLARIGDEAGAWWAPCFADLENAHPMRGGDTGGTWERVLPDDAEQMDSLKRWEETVLIPTLQTVATSHLRRLGIAVLDQAEYLQAVEALAASFGEYAPTDWNVEILTGHRRMTHEPLGAERESIRLRTTPYDLRLVDPAEFNVHIEQFLRQAPRPHVQAIYALPEVLRRQFAPAPWLPRSGPPLLGIVGEPSGGSVAIAVLDRAVTPRQLTQMFTTLPTVVLTTLTTTREREFQDRIVELDEVVILVDLPLRLQLDAWLLIDDRVHFRVMPIEGAIPLELTVFHLDALPNCWFISIRSQEGFAEVAQLFDRHRNQLIHDLDLPDSIYADLTAAVRCILTMWQLLSEIPDD